MKMRIDSVTTPGITDFSCLLAQYPTATLASYAFAIVVRSPEIPIPSPPVLEKLPVAAKQK